MPNRTQAEKITNSIKGLRSHLYEGEEPVLALPAIWDGGQGPNSTQCDVIVTNQRVIGYYLRSFPRERLFFDEMELSSITNVTWRDKKYEPVFRELLISNGKRKIYIRTPRKKSEQLYEALHAATRKNVNTISSPQVANNTADTTVQTQEQQQEPHPQGTVYGREDIQRAFDTSPLAIMLLFVGGITLEIIGVILWVQTRSAQTGFPLIVAGFVAVGVAIYLRRQNR